MWTIRLLVVATLLGPIIAESCDVGSITLEDVTETLTITNASASQDAVVLVTFSDASSSLRIAAGTSRTSTVVGATDYAIEVLAPAQPAGNSYETYLRGIRTDLIDLVRNPGDSGATVESVFDNLQTVNAALAQLHGSKTSQSCGHDASPNGHNQATIAWTEAGVGGVWTLSCE